MRRRTLLILLPSCVWATHCGTDKTTPAPNGAPTAGLDGSAPDATVSNVPAADAGAATDGAKDSAAPDAPSSPPLEAGSPSPPPDAGVGDSVLTHHKNANRDGAYVEAALTKAAVIGGSAAGGSASGLHPDPAFRAVLPDPNDDVFAQPLFVDGQGGQDLVIVATSANNVYALDAATGAQVWGVNVGTPVPLASKPCGNLNPFGVTGTPVIDLPSRTIFFDAEILSADAGALPRHEIFGLAIDTGAVRSGFPLEVSAVARSGASTFNSPFQGQRGALAIVGGTLYVPFGGLYGDCQPVDAGPGSQYPDPDFSPYRGWVVAVPIANPSAVQSWATPACGGGAWAPGGIASDGTSIYITTGNMDPSCTKQGTVWGGGDAVLRFGTGAAFGPPADYFAPTNWPTMDTEDLDLGTTPIVFDLANSTPGKLAIEFGKDGAAYLLDRTHLGNVGRAIAADGGVAQAPFATMAASLNQIITAPALYATATATYVTFRANGAFCTGASGDIATLTITPGTPPTLAGAWCGIGGSGSPMVTTSDGHSDAIVWQMGADTDSHLHAFDGDTGAPLAFPGASVTIPNMRRYNSPIAAKGRIFVAADRAVVAFTP